MSLRSGRLTARPAVLMAAGTTASRITGFARTAALAAVLGLTPIADSYNGAIALPTMLLVLVTGGTLSSALVPILATPEDEPGRRRAGASILVAVAVVTAIATVLMALAAPLLSGLLAVSAPAGDRADRGQMTTLLLLVFAPQLLLIGVSVAATAMLTAAGRLGRVGVTPVLANVVTLLGLAVYVAMPDGSGGVSATRVAVLGLGATVGVAVTTAVQLWGCRDLLPPWRQLHREVDRDVLRRLRTISRWGLLYVVSNQLGLLIILVVAGAATGVLSAYQWAFTVMQLPYAVAAVSALSSAYPALARAGRNVDDLVAVLGRTVGILWLLLLPAAAAMMVFSDLVSRALLGFGAADRDVALLSGGIALFALALVPFSLFQLLARACYSRNEPRLPALANVVLNVVNVAGALLALSFGTRTGLLAALVLANAAAYAVGCVVLGRMLHRDLHKGLPWGSRLGRACLAAGAAASVAVLARVLVPAPWGTALALVLFGAATAVLILPPLRDRPAGRPAG